MANDTAKLARLKDMRYKLSVDQFSDEEKRALRVADTDGTLVQLSSPDALAVLDRRIAAIEAAGAP